MQRYIASLSLAARPHRRSYRCLRSVDADHDWAIQHGPVSLYPLCGAALHVMTRFAAPTSLSQGRKAFDLGGLCSLVVSGDYSQAFPSPAQTCPFGRLSFGPGLMSSSARWGSWTRLTRYGLDSLCEPDRFANLRLAVADVFLLTTFRNPMPMRNPRPSDSHGCTGHAGTCDSNQRTKASSPRRTSPIASFAWRDLTPPRHELEGRRCPTH